MDSKRKNSSFDYAKNNEQFACLFIKYICIENIKIVCNICVKFA